MTDHANIGAARGAIALCSRGLPHSRTWESIEEARALITKGRPHNWRVRLTHDKPIPEAQNSAVERIFALDPGVEWILFVEEDVVIPRFLFSHFDESPVQAVNYTLPGGIDSIKRSRFGILFCGLGCTLIHKNVFVTLGPAPFQIGTQYSEEDGRLVPTFQGKQSYGGQDIDFCFKLQRERIPIREVPNIRAGHLRVTKMGAPDSNCGYHEVVSI